MKTLLGNNQTSNVIEQRTRIVEKMGFQTGDAREWSGKWLALRGNAHARGVECELTFSQYMRKVMQAGITSPSQIGCRIGQYQMARKTDTGNYSVRSCRFVTHDVNAREVITNGGRDRMRAKLLGRTKTSGDPGAISRSKKMERKFRVVDPSGKVYTGKNLKEFCKKRGMYASTFGSMINKGKTYKGWSGQWLDEE